MDKKYNIGYTQGTYDLFHIGHLNLIEHAKELCNYLIVGVNSDELVLEYKNKKTNLSEQDRARIVNALKAVDKVVITHTLDKEEILKKIKYDVIFIGDDWKGNKRWEDTEKTLSKYGIPVEYLPHTDGISTTDLTKALKGFDADKRGKDEETIFVARNLSSDDIPNEERYDSVVMDNIWKENQSIEDIEKIPAKKPIINNDKKEKENDGDER